MGVGVREREGARTRALARIPKCPYTHAVRAGACVYVRMCQLSSVNLGLGFCYIYASYQDCSVSKKEGHRRPTPGLRVIHCMCGVGVGGGGGRWGGAKGACLNGQCVFAEWAMRERAGRVVSPISSPEVRGFGYIGGGLVVLGSDARPGGQQR